MCAATVECADALCLVHAKCGIEQRGIVKIVQVAVATFAVEKLAHIIRAVHLLAVFQSSDGQVGDVFHGQVEVFPVGAIVGVSVKIHLVGLVIFMAWVVHHHDERAVELLAVENFLGKRFWCIFLALTYGAAVFVLECIFERGWRFAIYQRLHAIDFSQHLGLGRLDVGSFLAFGHHVAQLETKFAQFRLDERCGS